MKKDIHPNYYKTKVICSCGAAFEVGSTLENLKVEVCSQCHPVYTGNKKMFDSAGRVDRFKARMEKTSKMKDALTSKPKKSEKPVEEPKEEKTSTKES